MRTLNTQELKAVSGGAPVAQYYTYDTYYYYPTDYYYYYPTYGYNAYYYDPYYRPSYYGYYDYSYDYLAAGLLLGAAAGYALA